MLKDFIDKTREFLSKTDINFRGLDIREVELHEDDTRTLFLYASDSFQRPAAIASNVLFQVLIFFALADAKADYVLSSGGDLSKRYKHLPEDTDEDIIFKNSYRVLKILRNAATHSRTAISQDGDTIKAAYTQGKRDYKLAIQTTVLELIYTYILDAFVPDGYPKEYKDGVARTINDEILLGVTIQDESGTTLLPVPEGLRLGRERVRIINSSAQVNGGLLQIRTVVTEGCNPQGKPCEFLVTFKGKPFLLPEEALDERKAIPLSKLDGWYTNITRGH